MGYPGVPLYLGVSVSNIVDRFLFRSGLRVFRHEGITNLISLSNNMYALVKCTFPMLFLVGESGKWKYNQPDAGLEILATRVLMENISVLCIDLLLIYCIAERVGLNTRMSGRQFQNRDYVLEQLPSYCTLSNK